MLQTSLLLMKSLIKTETPIFLSVVSSLFPKAIFLTFIFLLAIPGWFAFVFLYLSLISPSLSDSGRLCFVIVALPR